VRDLSGHLGPHNNEVVFLDNSINLEASTGLDVEVSRLLSEEMRRAVGTILEAGFQMESEAFKTLVEKGREDSLKPLVDEVLKMASLAQPRPLFISADLVLKAAEQLDLATGSTVPVQEGLGHGRRFAEERESRLEVVFDPTGKLGTTGAFDDFLRYFRSRFENCLLYTSPSPRDLSTSRMPSSA